MTGLSIFGAALIIAAGAVYGVLRSVKIRKHLVFLGDICTALEIMDKEIGVLQTPMPALFEKLAGTGPMETRGFFAGLCRGGEEPLSQRWQMAAGQLPLGREESRSFCALGIGLGGYDAAAQCARIQNTMRSFDKFYEEARTQTAPRQRVCMALSVSAAAILAIILI